jgi:hypothetical protein
VADVNDLPARLSQDRIGDEILAELEILAVDAGGCQLGLEASAG